MYSQEEFKKTKAKVASLVYTELKEGFRKVSHKLTLWKFSNLV